MTIEIKYDTWEEAQFLLRNVKSQTEQEGLMIQVQPSEKFKQAQKINNGKTREVLMK